MITIYQISYRRLIPNTLIYFKIKRKKDFKYLKLILLIEKMSEKKKKKIR